MRPVAESNGHDRPGLIDEFIPSETTVIEDIGVGLEDPV
tara:strand:+ start:424 stop:540 length:117 start_codon:yes stop_codon:yes gene_type:complete